MALQYFDKRLFGAYVMDAWQQHFGVEIDPADGQWYTTGPNNNGGLYGALTDTLATELVFDTSKQVFTPHQIAASTAIVDNRNGLTPAQTVTLTYQYADSTTSTHATTNSVKVGVSQSEKFISDFEFVKVEDTTTISFEYSYSWTDTTSTTTTETETFQQAIPISNVPTGKVYQVVLMCNKQELKVPYHANIYLTGTSSACFASPVQGQKIWTVDAGTLCEWINKFGSADTDSYKFGRDPANPQRGCVSLAGNLTATKTANFTAMTMDITDTFNPSQPPALTRSVQPGDVPLPQGRPVNEIPLGH